MNTQLGKLTGVGEVRGPDGTLKATFTVETECSKEQAEQLALQLSAPLEESNNGDHARN